MQVPKNERREVIENKRKGKRFVCLHPFIVDYIVVIVSEFVYKICYVHID